MAFRAKRYVRCVTVCEEISLIDDGYPVSREFTFFGCQTQLFQRLAMQQCGDQGVGTLNVLEDGLLPYNHFQGTTVPLPDPALIAAAPGIQRTMGPHSITLLRHAIAVVPLPRNGSATRSPSSVVERITRDTSAGERALS